MQSLPTGRRGHIDVNGVSLIDLKAEIARRQSEVKARATTVPNVTGAVLKREGDGSGVGALLRRPPSPPQKLKAKEEASGAKETGQAEDVEWERARRKLEAKARLYEALRQAAVVRGKEGDDDDDRAPLVDFERKAVEEERCVTDSSDEDACEDRSGPRKARPYASVTAEPVSIPEGPVTYAHLRQGEVRDHGTGFYAFSADAEQRSAEQAALRELRHRTERARERVEEERAKRTVAMGRRLAQLRARKGLPDVATAAANLLEKNTSAPQSSPTPPSPPLPPLPPSPSPPVCQSVVGEQLCSDDLDIASMLRRLRDEAEVKQAAAAAAAAAAAIAPTTVTTPLPRTTAPPSDASTLLSRKRPTREWDRGKSFVPLPPKSRFVTYNHKQSDERNPEFAPPGFYS